MAVSVSIAFPFRKFTGGLGEVEGTGNDLADLIEFLDSRYPGLKASIVDGDGKIMPHLILFINDTDAACLKGLRTPLRPNDHVALIPAIAGGESAASHRGACK